MAPAQVGAQDLTNGQQTMIRLEDRERAMEEIQTRCELEESAIMQYQERHRLQLNNQFHFPDVEHHWGISQIIYSYQWGIINGYPDGTFKPDKTISGNEGTIMLSRLMDCIQGERRTSASPGGITTEERLKLSRMEFLQMFVIATELPSNPVPEQTVLFLDQQDIPIGMLGNINTMRNIGLVFGHEGYLNPNSYITRAEAASIIARYISILENPITF